MLRRLTATQITGQSIRIKDELDRVLGSHHCRWSKRIVVIGYIVGFFRPSLKMNGAKSVECHILITRQRANSPLLWRTLIHELIHSYSVEPSIRAYNAYPGWEEGVVEQLQRLLRPRIFQALNFNLSQDEEGLIEQEEQSHVYNRYINSLEGIRNLLRRNDKLAFYIELLRQPLHDRPWWTERMIKNTCGPDQIVFFELFRDDLARKL